MVETHIIKDRENWENWLSNTNCDVYDHFDYVQVNCEEGESPELFVAKHSKGMLIYPYIRRQIDDMYDDLVTAYGYGGPFRTGTFTNNDVGIARQIFLRHTENVMTVSETIRYHPLRFDPSLVDEFGRAVPIRQTVHIKLDQDFEELKGRFHKMTRRNVRRAIREDLAVVTGDEADLQTFIDLYETTMNRRCANNGYYFPKSYFESLLKSDSFESEFLFAIYEEEIIAGVLILYGIDGAHYHLGGSNQDFLSLRPNHLLFSEMIRRSLDRGMEYLHLGGGVTGNDALYDFKKSFSGEEPLTYWIGEAVLNDKVYSRLNERHIQLYGTSDYFPMYRTPIDTSEQLSRTK